MTSINKPKVYIGIITYIGKPVNKPNLPKFALLSAALVKERMLKAPTRPFSELAKIAAADSDRHATTFTANQMGLGYRGHIVAADLIEKHGGLKADGHLLDLGAGSGLVSAEFKKRAPNLKVTATDVSTRMLEQVQKIVPDAECVLASLENELPFPDKSFDCVTMMNVMHYIRRTKFLPKEIARVLKPQGLAVFDMVQLSNVMSVNAAGKGLVHLHDPKVLVADMARAGLKMLEQKTMSPYAQMGQGNSVYTLLQRSLA